MTSSIFTEMPENDENTNAITKCQCVRRFLNRSITYQNHSKFKYRNWSTIFRLQLTNQYYTNPTWKHFKFLYNIWYKVLGTALKNCWNWATSNSFHTFQSRLDSFLSELDPSSPFLFFVVVLSTHFFFFFSLPLMSVNIWCLVFVVFSDWELLGRNDQNSFTGGQLLICDYEYYN